MSFKERYLTEVSAHTGTSASPTTANSTISNKTGSPSNIEQILKNDEATPTQKVIQDVTKAAAPVSKTQKNPETNSGFADLHTPASTDVAKPTINDIKSKTEMIARLTNARP
jgi:hypothetical protein